MGLAGENHGERARQGRGVLYLVATPIGNLEDVTLRALRVLREVDLIAAEDTRHVRKLLERYGIRQQVVSYHEHNEQARTPQLLAALRSGRSVALVSDAGTPVLSDPGYRLVRACVEASVPVVPVPGPSAVTAALVASGLPADRFLFLGFPPRRRTARRRFLEEVKDQRATLVLFESPRRLADCLQDLVEVLGDRRVAVCRELTKVHEEVRRGRASELVRWARGEQVRGEVTLVVEGAVAEGARSAGEGMRLFVYGTLKNPELVRSLTGRTFPSRPARLPGWVLVPAERSASGYPEVEPRPGSWVEGLLLEGLDESALRALDAYEEGYVRRRVQVQLDHGPVEAELYVPVHRG